MTERLALSVDEVAALLGVGRDCVYGAVKKREIPSLKVSGRVVIPRRWLEEALNLSAAAISDALTSTPPLVDASEFGTADSSTADGPWRASAHDRVSATSPGESTVHSKSG